MSKTLIQIAHRLKNANKKYAIDLADLTEDDKRVLRYLVKDINTRYCFQQAEI
jgi:hypothetical protein